MKRNLLAFFMFVLALGFSNRTMAVLPDGSDAKDWTLTDINGQTYHLFDLLNQGKTVFIDFSATWCGPCWNYHNSGALENLYESYGPPGSNEVMVFFIEADLNTNLACLYGLTGCVGGTQGNWVAGTPYPIIDLVPSTGYVASDYSISYYPTIYAICPQTKKVYESGQVPASVHYSYVSSCALDFVVDNVVDAKCNGSKNGSISISTQQGSAPFSYKWSNGAKTQDIVNLAAGSYYVTITDKNGIFVESQEIIVGEPDAVEVQATVVDEGCEGTATGEITADGSGGNPGYTYSWSNGKNTATITGLTQGDYTVIVTDANGCTATNTYSVSAQPLPEAYAGPDDLLNCVHNTLILEGEADFGSEFTYEWSTSNGHIVSGGNTLNPEIDKPGTYKLLVTNTSTGCAREDQAVITSDYTTTQTDAGDDGLVNCTSPSIVLDGSKSSKGANIQYLWTTGNRQIVSGGNTNKATVNKGGTYKLTTTHAVSGCTSEDEVVVTENLTGTTAVLAPAGEINCENPEITLDGTASSQGADVEYSWTTNGGNFTSSTDTNFVKVNAAGEYFLIVTNKNSLCKDTANVVVVSDGEVPVANAGSGSELNCNVTTIQLDGTKSSQGADFDVNWSTQDGNILSGADTYSPTVNAPGTYVIAITNTVTNCTSYSSVVITEDDLTKVPDAIYNYTANLLNLNFQDASTGVPSTYAWDFGDGQTSTEQNPTHTYLLEGTYTICLTVTNACGTDQSCQTITVSSSLNLPTISDLKITDVTCKGGSNGCIDITVINGIPPYTFAWSNGLTTEDPCNIPAGSYAVTITDTDGNQTVSASISINELYYINVNNTFVTEPDCNDNNGSIALDINSNGGQLTYAWSHDSTLNNAVAENLPEGNYSVIITDANGCTSQQSVVVTDNGQHLDGSASSLLCWGDQNGQIQLTVSGGTQPYTFQWNNGSTTEDLANLSSGTYTCNVTDSLGCVKTIQLVVSSPDQITADMATVKPQKGKDNGSITATVAGGTAPFQYLWNNGSTDPVITNLAPGTYTLKVIDANGCIRDFDVVLEEAVGTLSLDILEQVNVYPNPSNGNFWIEATFSKNTVVDLTILDLLGREVVNQQFEGNEFKSQIDMHNFNSGTYFIRISADNGMHVEKMSIVK